MKKFYLNIFLILVLAFNLNGKGVNSGTIISNLKTFGLNRNATLRGELIGFYTNNVGFTNYTGLTNITKVTVRAGYDLSSLPSTTSSTGDAGSYVEYYFNITNNANTSDIFTVKIKFISTDDPDWVSNIFSVSNINKGEMMAANVTSFSSHFTNSADEVLRLVIRHNIPIEVANGSTNRLKFEIYNSYYAINNQGDNWPGKNAILPATPDTNNLRDYQVCYITTKAKKLVHFVSVISAEDLVHKITKFDGSEYLANTVLKIAVRVTPPAMNPNTLYLIYNINKEPTGSNLDDVKIKLYYGGQDLWYATIDCANDNRIKPGVKFNFIITVDYDNYYYTGVKPYSFNIRAIIAQRNNVTILNNLINPLKGDKAILFYSLNEPDEVEIKVYTLSGEVIGTLYKGYQSEGVQQPVYWDGKNQFGEIVGEGLYFISFRSSKINELRKVIVIK